MNRMKGLFLLSAGFLFAAMGLEQVCQAQVLVSRVKDIAKLDGAQDNPLMGYGLVAGLEGTGDGRRGFTAQTLTNMMAGMGINVLAPESISTEVIPENVASVMVVANLRPFSRPGSTMPITVISIGKAKSLQGGFLLPTPLKGADGQVHGLASGPVSLGGFLVSGGGGGGAGAATIQKNHAAVGYNPKGAIVEGEAVYHEVLQPGPALRWLLQEPDFKTASNLQRKINSVCEAPISTAEDASAVRVALGVDEQGKILIGKNSFDSLVDVIAFIDDITVETDEIAKIVINERTGTIVGGANIKVRNVVISHGALHITVQQTPEVTPGGIYSQPVETTQTTATATEDTGKVKVLEASNVGQVVSSLTEIGYSPRDIIAILQSMAAAGAIKAEIVMQQ